MRTSNIATFSTTQLLVMAVVAVVGALLAVIVWTPLSNLAGPYFVFLGPLGWIATSGVYMISPVLIGLLLQRPGVATVYGLVQGVLELLLANPYGPLAILFAAIEGLGVDLALAPFRWRASLPGALLAGALGNLLVDVVYMFYFNMATPFNLVMGGLVALISGAVLGGLVAWLLAQALHRTGVTAGLGGLGYEVIK